ncbi:MAG: hypothetical protein ACOYYS_19365 [Chloroflexota bacterium]
MITEYDKRAIQQYRQIAHLLPLVAVLVRLNYPATVTELAEDLGAHHETTRTWLRQLQAIQPPPVTRLKSGWILTPKGRNLFLTVIFPQVFHILSTGKQELSTAFADDPRMALADHPRNRALESGLPIEFTTTQLNKPVKENSSNLPADDPRKAADDPRTQEIYRAFEQVGIEVNRRTAALAQMEHITPSYIRAMYADLERRSKHRDTGLLIKLLEDNQRLSARINMMDYVDQDGWEANEIRNQYNDWES